MTKMTISMTLEISSRFDVLVWGRMGRGTSRALVISGDALGFLKQGLDGKFAGPYKIHCVRALGNT